MELVEFGPDDVDLVDAFVAVVRACEDHDAPWAVPLTRYRQQCEMRYGWDGEVGRFLLAYVDGEPVGTLGVHASHHDNPDLAWIELQIHPAHRRAGRGSELLAAVSALAAEAGRTLLLFEGWESEATTAFAAKHGYPLGSVAALRLQELTWSASEVAGFEAALAEATAASPAYDVVRIEGRTPAALLDGLVEATAAINDAPLDDLEYEDEVYDVARVQAYEEAQLASGYRFRRVVAIERSTGAVAGHTTVSVDVEQPAYGDQHDTSVVPAHRGHRLGLRLKAEMLCWLADVEPQLAWISTTNAASNKQMIAVNERLGQRFAGHRTLFQARFVP